MIKKIDTQCCALCQLSISDDETEKNIKKVIDNLIKESNSKNWKKSMESGGQRAVFCITTPSETNLENILKKLNFNIVNSFKRRTGYPEGKLKMWMFSW